MPEQLLPIGPPAFVLLALACYRIVAFFVADSLIGFNEASGSMTGMTLRNWARDTDGNDKVWWRGRLYDLLSCTFCLGAHVCWIATCLWLWVWPWQLGREGWLTAIALAGAQALLNALDHFFTERPVRPHPR